MEKSQGFTLVELVTVIIILGVLSAVAAPRFVNLQGSARAAAVNGLRASVASAATLAHAFQLASGLASNSNITVEGSPVTMLNGYPTATSAGIGNMVRVDSASFTSTGSGPIIFRHAANTSCQFSYTAATTTASPVISAVVASAC